MHLRTHSSSTDDDSGRSNARRSAGHSHTPLFLAARNGLTEHVRLLREAGAHLYPGEWTEAINEANVEEKAGSEIESMERKWRKAIWSEAGVDIQK